MADKQYFIGTQGPFTYDDADTPAAFDTSGTIRVATAPVGVTDILRLDDVGGGGPVAPSDAEYIVVSLDGDLSAERVLAVNATNLSLTDAGVNDNITVDTIQDIDVTATPTFAGMTISAIPADTDNTVIISVAGVLSSDEIDPKVWAIKLVDYTGTPVDNQIGIFTAAGTIEGDADLTWDASVLNVIGTMGVGIARTDGTLHVHTATAGAALANANADDLIVENSAAGGISVLVPDNVNSSIFFGSPSDVTGGVINWNYDNNLMKVGTGRAAASLIFMTGNTNEAVRILGSGNVGIGVVDPDTTLEVFKVGTQLKLSGGAADYATFAVAADGAMTITTVDDDAAEADIIFMSDGNIGVDTADPAAKLHVIGTVRLGDQATNYTAFAADGYQTMVGTARVMKEVAISASVATLGASAPGRAIVGNFSVLQFSGVGVIVEEAHFTFHIPRDYASGTDLDVHVHWAPTNANAGNVVWQMDGLALESNNNELLTDAPTSFSVTDATESLADELLESGDMNIPAVGLSPEDTVSIRIYRDPAHASDTYGSDVSLVLVEIKYTADKLGVAT